MTCIDNIYINRLGEINLSTFKEEMKIVEYNNSIDIKVMFKNGYITKSTYTKFKSGNIKNPYNKRVLGIGYMGEGKYNSNKDERIYKAWIHMLERCYNTMIQEKHPTYKECTVCEEWYNFQNFAKWYNENYYTIEGQNMQIDKDILFKDNKVYSPDTCILVSKKINILFVRNISFRGNNPIGVTFYKRDKKYDSQCNNNDGENIFLGRYNTPEEAFYAYKIYKESLIKEIADKYKNKIPNKLYEAMYNYKVEITD